jgi:adenylate cyclase
MSGDPAQEYFSDGITEDIITELSRFSELFVIARNSSFQYKGKSPDIRQVGRELGVRYVLEGSTRRGGDRVRITAQLIDAATGAHRWAERYDRGLKDVFAVQDEVTRTIVTILATHVHKAEIERTLLKPPASWQAHDYYMRAVNSLTLFNNSFKAEEIYDARRFLAQSLAMDQNYARAHAKLAFTYLVAWINPLDGDHLSPVALDKAHGSARNAVQLDPNLADAYVMLGNVLVRMREYDQAIAAFEKAISLNPNFTDFRFATVLVYAGELARALEFAKASMRLDPFYSFLVLQWVGIAHYLLKQYDEAQLRFRECASRAPNFVSCHTWLAATYAQLGKLTEATLEAAEVLRINPKYTIDGTQRIVSVFKRPEDIEHLLEGLRRAGLPEK